MNAQVCALKRTYEELADLCSQPGATPQQHQDLQQAKRGYHRRKRQKITQLKAWENEYWHEVGLQAEPAERKGDQYELYKVLNRLKLRGVAKKHMGERQNRILETAL